MSAPYPRTPDECHESAAAMMADPAWLAQMRANVRDHPEEACAALAFMTRLSRIMGEAAGYPRVPAHIRADMLRCASDCARACELIRSASREVN